MVKSEEDNPITELEEKALADSEADVVGYDNPHDKSGGENLDEDDARALELEEGARDVSDIPAEIAAISTENITAKEATQETQKIAKEKLTTKHGKRYLTAKQLIILDKKYNTDEAIELVKKTATTKFDGSIEIHIKLLEKSGKKKANDEVARGIFHLPHGLGKELKVVVLDEKIADQIVQTKKIDFDIAIATPEMMSKIGKIAKILGPKGKMPNPRFGTVTDNPQRVIEEIKSGRTEYRVDAGGVIHQMVGKISWESAKIADNILAVLQSLPKGRIKSVVLTSTMGPSVRIEW